MLLPLKLKAEAYPASDNGVHVFGVTIAQCHEVSIECSDAL